MSRVLLTTTPTDMSYEHVLDFEDRASQYEYYVNRDYAKVIELNIPSDAYRIEFEIDMTIDEVAYYDYCVIIGQDIDYYYFITGRIQKGSWTIVNVELDVLNTYYHYMKFNDSFVDRCHVPRWTDNGLPTANYEDEGMEYGVMVIESQEKIKQCPLNFVICSSTPIGKLSSSDPTPEPSGDWQNGVPSKQLFRFIKGYEGFAPNLYNDSGGVATIGYGITGSEPTQFNQLKANQPCSEELCAKTAWQVLPKNYGVPIVEVVKSYGITKQQQFDALVDLSYNAGTGRILNPNGDLSKAIKRNPLDEGYIRPIWENYIVKDAQGTILEGLKLRRKAECDMYFKGVYEKRKIPIVGAGGAITGSFDGDGWLPS